MDRIVKILGGNVEYLPSIDVLSPFGDTQNGGFGGVFGVFFSGFDSLKAQVL